MKAAAAVVLASFTVLSAQQKPVFRSELNLIQLDVVVLDRDGQPVRGLKQDDFRVFEDGREQNLQGFAAIDVPDREVEPAWADRAPLDVVSNGIDNQRIFVLMLDDAMGMGLYGQRAMKESATQFVQALGPKDLAAVVFTGTHHRQGQNLTLDRARLIRAIQSYPELDGALRTMVAPPVRGHGGGPCLAHKEVLRLMESVVDNLSTLPDRRKAIVYFSPAMPWAQTPQSNGCGTFHMWRDVFEVAQQGHVTINPIHPSGGDSPVDAYRAVAANTGGRAVIRTTDLWSGLQRILVENSSYYLLAYQPTNQAEDGTFRRLRVKVDREDVEVHTRENYWARRAPRPAARPGAKDDPADEQRSAIAGVLPLPTLSLRAAAIPFAGKRRDSATVALVVGLQHQGSGERANESVEVTINAFTTNGDAKGREVSTVPVALPAVRDDRRVPYDVLSRIELPRPGKYQLRLSVHSAAVDRRGSIYIDVEAPDFRKEKLSMSGVVVGLLPGSGPVAPERGLSDITAVPPTTEREFSQADAATAFVRIYQGGSDPLGAVSLTSRVRDAKDEVVFTQEHMLVSDRFNKARAADFQLRLPLSKLVPGEYLLTIDGASGNAAAMRTLKFTVKR